MNRPPLPTEHLKSAWNITIALKWLALAGIEVTAFKSVTGNAPVIQILPTETHYDNPLNGCTIAVKEYQSTDGE